mmetsp:Transcript_93633/g.260668  ORF Transcript_93633/g.260668 Transcript_93633/m.260668 type:complete len:334 (+) Transcript_93633:56-1057(+)
MTVDSNGDTTGWRCIITEYSDVGSGMFRYTQYHAQCTLDGGRRQELLFRFSQVDRLYQILRLQPDLSDLVMPRLPPKVTLQRAMKGRFDAEFLQERQALLQQFFDSLAGLLNAKYGVIGNVLDLCEPLGEFVRLAAGASAAASGAAIAAADAAIRLEEDRAIIASQEREYEESLQIDELRQVEEAERHEREERMRLEEAMQAQVAAAEAAAIEAAAVEAAAARAKDIARRRAAFETVHGEPEEAEAQAMLRFRAPSGATTQRRFSESTNVAALFEFAAIAEWDGPGPGCTFDLRTSFPVRSLKGLKEQTLKEAGLCPSAALLVAINDDESPHV